MTRLATLCAAAATTLALCAPAIAAPIQLSTAAQGASIGTAIDEANTLYVAWLDKASTPVYKFCRIPAGATSCTPLTLNLGGPVGNYGRAYVFLPAPGTVAVAASRGSNSDKPGEYLLTSTNGGVSFGPAADRTQVWDEGTDELTNGAVLVGLGGNANLLAAFDGVRFQAGDNFAETPIQLGLDDLGGYYALSTDTTGHPVAVAGHSGSSPGLYWRRYTGTDFSEQSLNSSSKWSPKAQVPAPASLGVVYRDPSMATGPSGLYLGSDANPRLWKFNGSGWDGPTLAPVPASRFIEDAGGRLHGYGNDFGGGECYSHTDTTGANPTPLTKLPTDLNPGFARFAVNSTGGGYLVGIQASTSFPPSSTLLAEPLADATSTSGCAAQQTPDGHVVLRGSFTVHSDGTFTITFECADGVPTCTGTIVVTLARFGRRAVAAKAPLTIGSNKWSVPGGQTSHLIVRLNKKGRALLKKRGSLKAKVRVTYRGSGATKHKTKTVILKRG